MGCVTFAMAAARRGGVGLTMSATRPADPAVAVLFALFDPRGDPAAHLRTWTHGQTLPRERFQVVVASAAEDPATDRELAGMLAGHDRLERAPGVPEVGLYDVAAARATAPWLLVTEAHCAADPECLGALVRAIEADPRLDAATLEVLRVADEYAGRLGSRWFDRINDQWGTLHWKPLPLAGSAVRRDLYARAGGIPGRYGLFAPFALSARLHQEGATVGKAPGARVIHVQDGLRDHHGHSADFARGECDYRADHDPLFCERYFGHPDAWGRRLGYRREVARPLARTLAAATVRAAARRSGDTWWLLRELGRNLPSAAAGVRPHLARDRLGLGAVEHVLERLRGLEGRLFPGYLRAQDRVVRLTQLRWIRDHVGPSGPPARRTGVWPAESLDGTALVGAHGLEGGDGGRFRWTDPVALLRVAPPPGEHLLTIDTGSVRGPPLDYVRGVYAGGRRLRDRDLEARDGRLTVRLSRRATERAGATGIALLSLPLEPRRHGSLDGRRLGMPVRSIEVRAAS